MTQNAPGFSSWYAQRHGYPPFPWQASLAKRIAADDWPQALTPPTGSGKTAIIDIWLWAHLHGLPLPRRLVYVIDRRLVVDSVSRYASELFSSLDAAQRPTIVTLRGGLTIDEDWLTDPLRLTLIVSTVDQVGSRLLFSGYGINPKSASLHAGLLGNDALFVLDEVHLLQPLQQTLASIGEQRGNALPLPWRMLAMSATWPAANSHGLGDADRAHPVLSRRLKAGKPAQLIEVKAPNDPALTLVKEARRLRQAGAEVVAVVCNRVDRARAVFDQLQSEDEAILLTGRIRPCDKVALSEAYLPRMLAGSRGHRSPLFVVATQTIEVGADLDMDALVTECAPLSALRQRFGRINRLGELATTPAVIVYQAPNTSDPVYGDDLKRAWQWLQKGASGKATHIDFGIEAMARLLAVKPPPAEDAPQAPALLSAHIDLLSCTSLPHGIDVAPWLHGWQRTTSDVYVCWRADWAKESVTAAPPVQQELLAVPFRALVRWSADIADIDGSERSKPARSGNRQRCIRWDGEKAEEIRLDEARPGQTLVLPTSVGGCDRYGWAPDCHAAVADAGDTAQRVRLHAAVHPQWAAEIGALLADEDTDQAAWHNLARQTGLLGGEPGRVLAYPGGCVVLRASEWTSESALRKVALREHLHAVGERAAALARGSGLSEALVNPLQRAGAGHDIGKQDARWQAMVGADGSLLLAKGPGGDQTWLSLPPGWRHEMASAVHQKDPLVRHLVGSHHGHGRPLLPAAPDIGLWRQLADWAESFAALQRTYGHWGLAYLEALLRIADWLVSAEEQA